MQNGASGVQTETTTETQTTEARTVPVEALQAERKARQAVEERIAAMEAATKAAAEKAAAEAGQFRELYEGAKPKLARLDELEKRETARIERVSARNNERIKGLAPEVAAALGPIMGKLDADELADWLDTSLPKLVASATVTRPAGSQARDHKQGEDAIPAAATADWKRFGEHLGVTEREWFENNWKPRQKGK